MKILLPKTGEKSTRKINRAWIVVALVAMLSVVMLAWMITSPQPRIIQNLGDSWVLRENQTGPVIGNFGGVPVSIPKSYAHFVEYDGDPHFMEERKGAPPKRTYESKLRSFGFEVRYPDMAALTTETEPQKKQENIYTTMWMRVGISSGSDYGGNPLENHINRKINLKQTFPPYRYEKSPNSVHGLTMYIPVGFDESKRNMPGGGDYDDTNVYFHRNQDGEADAYIECSNVTHAAAPCKLKFNMEPAMRANVSVSFRKELLARWKEIQSSITEVILGFRVNPSATIQQEK